ncbi:N-acetylmuramoyl-L-alanine amidase [Scopulibacillus darangshiensis]|uniref:N-acetylmuramoyl-L-alanine amidase n=1 Tax=Scopulibacillus darangshiensis TaxID=442528 RepID=A0A4R2NK91_9BACL|nr:N-acetylmuramoyl-L-alanine amidase [Scopulibacillus darangshiensis]TCP21917.1 N-acetylmuramoyl-L-alanine amidase [Scopulibacillus darangshiensis]
MFKLYLDPGHGGNDPGASGHGLEEKDITLDIALRIRRLLNGYENVSVKMSRTDDNFISLDQRTNEANDWDADYFLSIHCNAFNGSAHGYEDYIHDSLSDASITKRYQEIIHHEVNDLNRLTDRGQKKADFHVLRESIMPALLTENGFIDNAGDAAKMKDPSWRQKVAEGHVNGLMKAFKLKPKIAPINNQTLYKVIAGAFKNKDNAEHRVNYLDVIEIKAFVDPTYISGELWYRVQAGAFEKKDNAEDQVKRLKKHGIKAFIITDT